MKVLALDLSTKTGWAIIEDDNKPIYGFIEAPSTNNYELVPDYDQLLRAKEIANQIKSVIILHEAIIKFDHVYIEQTNTGSFRTSQKQLEFVHYAVLEMLREYGAANKVSYVDTSMWRRTLGIKLSTEQRAHNKKVSRKTAKGKITWKHLSVNWVNEKFGLELLLKDNDIADACCIAWYGFTKSFTVKKKDLNLSDIF
jgi:hypothetical protein